MKVDICYIISHGFAARMLLQTGLAERLLSSGVKVGIIAQDIHDENLSSLQESEHIKLVEWNPKARLWDDDYLTKRMYYLEEFTKNKALLEKFYNGLFFSNSKHPWKRARHVVYYATYLLIKVFPSIRRAFQNKEAKYLRSKKAESILAELQPQVLVSTYPVNILEARMLHAAKNANIQTVLHLLSWDNITSKGVFPEIADYFIVWGDIMKEELIEQYGVAEQNISTCGVAHFDRHVQIKEQNGNEPFLRSIGIDPDVPYLFFAMSSPRFAPREIDIIERLAELIDRNELGNELQLVVRPHPQNVLTKTAKTSWLKRLDRLGSKKVVINYPLLNHDSRIRWSMKLEDMDNLARLITGSSICLNSGSTVSIDALMHNKPVLITAFDGNKKLPYWNSARRLIDYTHLKKFIEEGGAKPVRSFDELKEAIRVYLNDPFFEEDVRKRALVRECFTLDGKATERVFNALLNRFNHVKV